MALMCKDITEHCLIVPVMTIGVLLVTLIHLQGLPEQNPVIVTILLTAVIQLQAILHTVIVHQPIHHIVFHLAAIHHIATALQLITVHIVYRHTQLQATTTAVQYTHHQ